MFLLGNFRALRPQYLPTQAETLSWLAHAHARAEQSQAALEGRPFEERTFLESMHRRLARFGCSADTIATRGHELDDCSHQRWHEMEAYSLAERPTGAGMRARTQLFGRLAGKAFLQLFADAETPPKHLIHVTCTGYDSPSAAQLLVAKNGWGNHTSVTHAYHMGCYAALPALRMATGFEALRAMSSGGPTSAAPRVDIAHTELCSLHMNPLRHDPEQLVIQSLFADGCIRYSVFSEAGAGNAADFAILALGEWLVPDSAGSMAWFCSDFGMEMILARDVPDKIATSLAPFVESLLEQAGEPVSARERAVFALHPGGPKIVDQIAATLGLTNAQVEHSRAVLRERGNMSSATLPHVWQAIARSARVPSGELVVSLAFGPGLTLSGAVLRKVSPC